MAADQGRLTFRMRTLLRSRACEVAGLANEMKSAVGLAADEDFPAAELGFPRPLRSDIFALSRASPDQPKRRKQRGQAARA